MEEETFNTIGELSFNREDVIRRGGLGVVFQGKFQNSIDVAIKRIQKQDVTSDFEVSYMTTSKRHPNVLHCYCVEQDVNFW